MNISIIKRPDLVREIVNTVFDLDITENTRQRDYVEARAVYYKILRTHERMSLSRISGSLRRNHATVIHSLNTFEMMIKHNADLEAMYRKCLMLYFEETGKTHLDEYRELFYSPIHKENKLHKLCDRVPEELVDNVYIRLEAIVNMALLSLKNNGGQ
jgi:hypothetical protein